MRKTLLSALALLSAATTTAIMTLPAQAADKTLTIYTYESFIAEWGPGAKVAAAFEETCDCKVEWVGVADGVELLTRLKLEGEGTKADIVLGLDTNLIAEAKATGLFVPHQLAPKDVTVPGGYSDDTFLPYDYGHFAIVYDTETLKNPPKSLKELVEGDSDEKIVIEDPRTSTPGLGLLLWVRSVYGDKAGEAWAKLKDRVLTVTPGWSEAYGLFTKGEAPMVLSYTTSPAYHMVAENTERYQAAAFSEGHYVQIEVAGMTRAADDPELARTFLSFMTGPQFQSIIPETNWMMPAAATGTPLPAAFDRLVKPEHTFLFSADEVAANRKAWIDEWLSAMSAK